MHHYTSIEVLYKIFVNNELWFGDIFSMKDQSEIKFNINNIYHDQNERNRKDIINYLGKNNFYVFCMTTLYNDMAQWERYAENAAGVCITFNMEKLCKYLGEKYKLYPVRYEAKTERIDLKELYDRQIEDEYHKIEGPDGIYQTIIKTSASCKDISYRQENEYRFLTEGDEQVEYKVVNHRIRKFKIIKILKSQNDINFEDTIEKITLGPASMQDIRTLKQFFVHLGYNSVAKKITKSSSGIKWE